MQLCKCFLKQVKALMVTQIRGHKDITRVSMLSGSHNVQAGNSSEKSSAIDHLFSSVYNSVPRTVLQAKKMHPIGCFATGQELDNRYLKYIFIYIST